ncbi:hypothetical protein J437_LFUL003573 [Ladona fulva]|uniref:Helicase C-terminal domain-containing protein n=1 Tax=Ladona fulva TaxID=123851 RepID=A0A8K0NVI5_LADFU|nr:hypothetical protein J437_LFUL003573 [Ladona fulva]
MKYIREVEFEQIGFDGHIVFQGKDGPVHLIEWTRIILDEAHIVRNYKSKTSQAISCLKGTYRWALTGTPIHNKELDIFALLVFLRCSPFDKYLVWCRWIDNKTVAGTQRMNMLMKSLMLRRTKDQLISKGSLISLPTRNEHCVVLDLDDLEQSVYDQILITSNIMYLFVFLGNSYMVMVGLAGVIAWLSADSVGCTCYTSTQKNLFAKFLDQHAERNAEKLGIEGASIRLTNFTPISKIWSNPLKPGSASAALKKFQENSDVKSHHIFVLLLRLRQICCHPALIQSMVEAEDYRDGGIVDETGLDIDLVSQLNGIKLVTEEEAVEEVSSKDEFMKNPLTLKNPIFKKERPSTKLKALLQCLEEKVLSGKDKAVVVSQWTSMLDIIGIYLKKRKIKYCLLSGSVPLKDRMDIIDSINNNERGPKVLLLSLQAGGVGLNLVGANHLLLVDLHWNPQLEAQACDRIYRVGQKKGVHIYRFVCKHTVEQKIQELQEKKLSLADSVLTGAKNPHGNKLTMEDLKTLFSLRF